MSAPQPDDMVTAKKSRLVGLVFVVTMIVWMGLQWLGARLGWEARLVFLFDLAALAAFIWGLVVTYQIWRTRQHAGSR